MFKGLPHHAASDFTALYSPDDWNSLADEEWANFLYNAQTDNPEFYFAFADHQEKPNYDDVAQAWASSYEDSSAEASEEEKTAQSVTSHPLLNPNIIVNSLTLDQIGGQIEAMAERSVLAGLENPAVIRKAEEFLKACGMDWAVDENRWQSGVVNYFSTANLFDNEKAIVALIESLQTPDEARSFVDAISRHPLAQGHSIYEIFQREFEGKQLGRVQGKLDAALRGDASFENEAYGMFAEDMEVISESMEGDRDASHAPTLEERLQVSYPDDPSQETPLALTKDDVDTKVVAIQISYFDIFDSLGFFKNDSTFPFNASEIFTMPPAVLVVLASAFINVKSKIEYVAKLHGLAHLQGATGFFSYFSGFSQLFRQNSETGPLAQATQYFAKNLNQLVDAIKKRSAPESLQALVLNLDRSMQQVMREAFVFESQEMEGVRTSVESYGAVAQACATASGATATTAIMLATGGAAGALWAFTGGTTTYVAAKTTGDIILEKEVSLSSTALNIKDGAVESGLTLATMGMGSVIKLGGHQLVERAILKQSTAALLGGVVLGDSTGTLYAVVKEGQLPTSEKLALYAMTGILGARVEQFSFNRVAKFATGYSIEVAEELLEGMADKESINTALIAGSMAGAFREASAFAEDGGHGQHGQAHHDADNTVVARGEEGEAVIQGKQVDRHASLAMTDHVDSTSVIARKESEANDAAIQSDHALHLSPETLHDIPEAVNNNNYAQAQHNSEHLPAAANNNSYENQTQTQRNPALTTWQNTVRHLDEALHTLSQANPQNELGIFESANGETFVGVGSGNGTLGEITTWYKAVDDELLLTKAPSPESIHLTGHVQPYGSTSTPSHQDLSFAKNKNGIGTLVFDEEGNASWSYSYPMPDGEVYTEYSANFIPDDTAVLDREYERLEQSSEKITDYRLVAMPQAITQVLNGNDDWATHQTPNLDIAVHTNANIPKPRKFGGPNEDGADLHVDEEGTAYIGVVDSAGSRVNAEKAKDIALKVTKQSLEGGDGFNPTAIQQALKTANEDGAIAMAMATFTLSRNGEVTLHPDTIGDSRVVVILPNGEILTSRDGSMVLSSKTQHEVILRNHTDTSTITSGIDRTRTDSPNSGLMPLATLLDPKSRNSASLQRSIPLPEGSVVLVMSDGAWGFANLEDIRKLVDGKESAKGIVEAIYGGFEEANRRTLWPREAVKVYGKEADIPNLPDTHIAYPFIDAVDGKRKFRVTTRDSLLQSDAVKKYTIHQNDLGVHIDDTKVLVLQEPAQENGYRYIFADHIHPDHFTAAAVIVKKSTATDEDFDADPETADGPWNDDGDDGGTTGGDSQGFSGEELFDEKDLNIIQISRNRQLLPYRFTLLDISRVLSIGYLESEDLDCILEEITDDDLKNWISGLSPSVRYNSLMLFAEELLSRDIDDIVCIENIDQYATVLFAALMIAKDREHPLCTRFKNLVADIANKRASSWDADLASFRKYWYADTEALQGYSARVERELAEGYEEFKGPTAATPHALMGSAVPVVLISPYYNADAIMHVLYPAPPDLPPTNLNEEARDDYRSLVSGLRLISSDPAREDFLSNYLRYKYKNSSAIRSQLSGMAASGLAVGDAYGQEISVPLSLPVLNPIKSIDDISRPIGVDCQAYLANLLLGEKFIGLSQDEITAKLYPFLKTYYRAVGTDEVPKVNDVILYFVNDDLVTPAHFGRIVAIDNETIWIESRWGTDGPTLLHPLDVVPDTYGIIYALLRVKNESHLSSQSANSFAENGFSIPHTILKEPAEAKQVWSEDIDDNVVPLFPSASDSQTTKINTTSETPAPSFVRHKAVSADLTSLLAGQELKIGDELYDITARIAVYDDGTERLVMTVSANKFSEACSIANTLGKNFGARYVNYGWKHFIGAAVDFRWVDRDGQKVMVSTGPMIHEFGSGKQIRVTGDGGVYFIFNNADETAAFNFINHSGYFGKRKIDNKKDFRQREARVAQSVDAAGVNNSHNVASLPTHDRPVQFVDMTDFLSEEHKSLWQRLDDFAGKKTPPITPHLPVPITVVEAFIMADGEKQRVAVGLVPPDAWGKVRGYYKEQDLLLGVSTEEMLVVDFDDTGTGELSYFVLIQENHPGIEGVTEVGAGDANRSFNFLWSDPDALDDEPARSYEVEIDRVINLSAKPSFFKDSVGLWTQAERTLGLPAWNRAMWLAAVVDKIGSFDALQEAMDDLGSNGKKMVLVQAIKHDLVTDENWPTVQRIISSFPLVERRVVKDAAIEKGLIEALPQQASVIDFKVGNIINKIENSYIRSLHALTAIISGLDQSRMTQVIQAAVAKGLFSDVADLNEYVELLPDETQKSRVWVTAMESGIVLDWEMVRGITARWRNSEAVSAVVCAFVHQTNNPTEVWDGYNSLVNELGRLQAIEAGRLASKKFKEYYEAAMKLGVSFEFVDGDSMDFHIPTNTIRIGRDYKHLKNPQQMAVDLGHELWHAVEDSDLLDAVVAESSQGRHSGGGRNPDSSSPGTASLDPGLRRDDEESSAASRNHSPTAYAEAQGVIVSLSIADEMGVDRTYGSLSSIGFREDYKKDPDGIRETINAELHIYARLNNTDGTLDAPGGRAASSLAELLLKGVIRMVISPEAENCYKPGRNNKGIIIAYVSDGLKYYSASTPLVIDSATGSILGYISDPRVAQMRGKTATRALKPVSNLKQNVAVSIPIRVKGRDEPVSLPLKIIDANTWSVDFNSIPVDEGTTQRLEDSSRSVVADMSSPADDGVVVSNISSVDAREVLGDWRRRSSRGWLFLDTIQRAVYEEIEKLSSKNLSKSAKRRALDVIAAQCTVAIDAHNVVSQWNDAYLQANTESGSKMETNVGHVAAIAADRVINGEIQLSEIGNYVASWAAVFEWVKTCNVSNVIKRFIRENPFISAVVADSSATHQITNVEIIRRNAREKLFKYYDFYVMARNVLWDLPISSEKKEHIVKDAAEWVVKNNTDSEGAKKYINQLGEAYRLVVAGLPNVVSVISPQEAELIAGQIADVAAKNAPDDVGVFVQQKIQLFKTCFGIFDEILSREEGRLISRLTTDLLIEGLRRNATDEDMIRVARDGQARIEKMKARNKAIEAGCRTSETFTHYYEEAMDLGAQFEFVDGDSMDFHIESNTIRIGKNYPYFNDPKQMAVDLGHELWHAVEDNDLLDAVVAESSQGRHSGVGRNPDSSSPGTASLDPGLRRDDEESFAASRNHSPTAYAEAQGVIVSLSIADEMGVDRTYGSLSSISFREHYKKDPDGIRETIHRELHRYAKLDNTDGTLDAPGGMQRIADDFIISCEKARLRGARPRKLSEYLFESNDSNPPAVDEIFKIFNKVYRYMSEENTDLLLQIIYDKVNKSFSDKLQGREAVNIDLSDFQYDFDEQLWSLSEELSAPFTIDLITTIPRHPLRKDVFDCVEHMVRICHCLVSYGWTPGALPSQEQLIEALKGEHLLDDNSIVSVLPLVSHEFKGARVIINGLHRLNALLLLASIGVLPRETLKNIPVQQPVSDDANPEKLIAGIVDMSVTSADRSFSWGTVVGTAFPTTADIISRAPSWETIFPTNPPSANDDDGPTLNLIRSEALFNVAPATLPQTPDARNKARKKAIEAGCYTSEKFKAYYEEAMDLGVQFAFVDGDSMDFHIESNTIRIGRDYKHLKNPQEMAVDLGHELWHAVEDNDLLDAVVAEHSQGRHSGGGRNPDSISPDTASLDPGLRRDDEESSAASRNTLHASHSPTAYAEAQGVIVSLSIADEMGVDRTYGSLSSISFREHYKKDPDGIRETINAELHIYARLNNTDGTLDAPKREALAVHSSIDQSRYHPSKVDFLRVRRMQENIAKITLEEISEWAKSRLGDSFSQRLERLERSAQQTYAHIKIPPILMALGQTQFARHGAEVIFLRDLVLRSIPGNRVDYLLVGAGFEDHSFIGGPAYSTVQAALLTALDPRIHCTVHDLVPDVVGQINSKASNTSIRAIFNAAASVFETDGGNIWRDLAPKWKESLDQARALYDWFMGVGADFLWQRDVEGVPFIGVKIKEDVLNRIGPAVVGDIAVATLSGSYDVIDYHVYGWINGGFKDEFALLTLIRLVHHLNPGGYLCTDYPDAPGTKTNEDAIDPLLMAALGLEAVRDFSDEACPGIVFRKKGESNDLVNSMNARIEEAISSARRAKSTSREERPSTLGSGWILDFTGAILQTQTQTERSNTQKPAKPNGHVLGLDYVREYLKGDNSPDARTKKPVQVVVYGTAVAGITSTAQIQAARDALNAKYKVSGATLTVLDNAATELVPDHLTKINVSIVTSPVSAAALDSAMLIKAIDSTATGGHVVVWKALSKHEQELLGLSDEQRLNGYVVYTKDEESTFTKEKMRTIREVQQTPPPANDDGPDDTSGGGSVGMGGTGGPGTSGGNDAGGTFFQSAADLFSSLAQTLQHLAQRAVMVMGLSAASVAVAEDEGMVAGFVDVEDRHDPLFPDGHFPDDARGPYERLIRRRSSRRFKEITPQQQAVYDAFNNLQGTRVSKKTRRRSVDVIAPQCNEASEAQAKVGKWHGLYTQAFNLLRENLGKNRAMYVAAMAADKVTKGELPADKIETYVSNWATVFNGMKGYLEREFSGVSLGDREFTSSLVADLTAAYEQINVERLKGGALAIFGQWRAALHAAKAAAAYLPVSPNQKEFVAKNAAEWAVKNKKTSAEARAYVTRWGDVHKQVTQGLGDMVPYISEGESGFIASRIADFIAENTEDDVRALVQQKMQLFKDCTSIYKGVLLRLPRSDLIIQLATELLIEGLKNNATDEAIKSVACEEVVMIQKVLEATQDGAGTGEAIKKFSIKMIWGCIESFDGVSSFETHADAFIATWKTGTAEADAILQRYNEKDENVHKVEEQALTAIAGMISLAVISGYLSEKKSLAQETHTWLGCYEILCQRFTEAGLDDAHLLASRLISTRYERPVEGRAPSWEGPAQVEANRFVEKWIALKSEVAQILAKNLPAETSVDEPSTAIVREAFKQARGNPQYARDIALRMARDFRPEATQEIAPVPAEASGV